MFLCAYRSDMGCNGEPAQPPATYLRPAAALLQPQRDCTVPNHRSDPLHPNTCAPAAPSHDRPLPADASVDAAGRLSGAQLAEPTSVPLCSAHSHTICTHCPSQPGGSSKPSQRDGEWPLSLSPGPHPAFRLASD